MERRTLLAAAAFAAGLFFAAAALYDGSAWSAAIGRVTAPSLLVSIETENVGPNDAETRVTLSHAAGGDVWTSRWITSGHGRAAQLTGDAVAGELIAQVDVDWAAPADGGRGTLRHVFTTEDCPDADAMAVRFVFDTSRGVAFEPGDRTRCL